MNDNIFFEISELCKKSMLKIHCVIYPWITIMVLLFHTQYKANIISDKGQEVSYKSRHTNLLREQSNLLLF